MVKIFLMSSIAIMRNALRTGTSKPDDMNCEKSLVKK